MISSLTNIDYGLMLSRMFFVTVYICHPAKNSDKPSLMLTDIHTPVLCVIFSCKNVLCLALIIYLAWSWNHISNVPKVFNVKFNQFLLPYWYSQYYRHGYFPSNVHCWHPIACLWDKDVECVFVSSSCPWLSIKMLSYQYRKSHCGDKVSVRSSDLHTGNSCAGKMTYFHWISCPDLFQHL